MVGGALATLAMAYMRTNTRQPQQQLEEGVSADWGNRRSEEARQQPDQTPPPTPGSTGWPQALTTGLSDALSQQLTFKTLDSAALILRLARSIEPRLQDSSLDDFYNKLTEVERAGMTRWKDFNGTQVVVIEGLAGSGKTVLIKGLLQTALPSSSSSKVDAVPFSEDQAVLNAKNIFSSMPEPVLKAFEYASNYSTALAIQRCGHKVAVVERFHHAVSAHSVCDQAAVGEDLTSLPSSVFDWPVDLPVPDLVIYLAVTSEQRLRRRKLGGGTSATDRSADRLLARDRRIELAYSLITGPHTVAIDASGSVEDTLAAALEACAEYSVALAPPSDLSPKRISLGVYGAWS